MMNDTACDKFCSPSCSVDSVGGTQLQQEGNASFVDVEMRCSLPVSLQTDVINGLLAMGIDPQPMIEEAILLSVEEKLGVFLSGTDAPIQWEEHIPKNSEKKDGNQKSVPSTTSSLSWCGSTVEKKAIVNLGVDQLGTRTHLLRDCLLSHLLEDIHQLHHLLHSIDSVDDSFEKPKRNSYAEPKNVEKKRDGSISDDAAPHAELHVLHKAKKTVDKMLQRFAQHDDEQRKLIPTAATTFPSSFQVSGATLKKKSTDEEKSDTTCGCPNSTIGEQTGEKGSEKISKDDSLTADEALDDRELLLPVDPSVSVEALLDGDSLQDRNEKMKLVEEQKKCFETEQAYSTIYQSPPQEGMRWNSSSYNAASAAADADADHSDEEVREWRGNLSDAEYIAMGYMPL